MNIVIESHIPFIQGIFEKAGHNVSYLAPEEFRNSAIRSADALVIRTRTYCNRELLENTNVRKIATATIGTDHIDFDYCKQAGIEVFSAPGCNAPGVAQYVISSIHAIFADSRPTIGIVGVGHVGSIVDRWARANNYPTMLCDPPRGLEYSLGDIAKDADVITFHTPLNSETRHMANDAFFSSLRRRAVIINSARGSIVDTPALIRALDCGMVRDAVIDCWENEPHINTRLLAKATIATPHIAGYSLQGKRRATAMAVMAIDSTISLPLDEVADTPTIEDITASYNPMVDTAALKNNSGNFEDLRNNYAYRSEPTAV